MQTLDQDVPKAAALSPSAGTRVAVLRELFLFVSHSLGERRPNEPWGRQTNFKIIIIFCFSIIQSTFGAGAS